MASRSADGCCVERMRFTSQWFAAYTSNFIRSGENGKIVLGNAERSAIRADSPWQKLDVQVKASWVRCREHWVGGAFPERCDAKYSR